MNFSINLAWTFHRGPRSSTLAAWSRDARKAAKVSGQAQRRGKSFLRRACEATKRPLFRSHSCQSFADGGCRNVAIAEAVGIGVRTISIWRREFLERRGKCLQERARSGRPRVFP